MIFFFNDTATTEIYTLSLHDALPICSGRVEGQLRRNTRPGAPQILPGRKLPLRSSGCEAHHGTKRQRSEEHTSELQSLAYLVCRLLLDNKHRDADSTSRPDPRIP